MRGWLPKNGAQAGKPVPLEGHATKKREELGKKLQIHRAGFGAGIGEGGVERSGGVAGGLRGTGHGGRNTVHRITGHLVRRRGRVGRL